MAGHKILKPLALVFTIGLLHLGLAEDCVKTGPCSCTYSDTHIDLSPVIGNPAPKFKDQYDQFYNNRFSYNPCVAFTEGTCTNMAVCQINSMSQYFPCGSQESAVFKLGDSNALTLQYSFHDGTTERTSIVELVCGTDADSLEVLGEGPTTFYKFKLRSKACCAVPGGLSVTVSISVGSVLVIVFFSVLFLYLVVGILFQKFARKASGKEIIPNYSFWSGFPSLVKDGACLVATRGKGKSGYSSI